AIRLLYRTHDRDMRARLELALVANHVRADDGVVRDDDLLLATLVFDGHRGPVNALHGLIDRAIGHSAVRPRVPRTVALAQPALRLGHHRYLDGALAAVSLRHGADAYIGARFDIGDRTLGNAYHREVSGNVDFHLAELRGFHREYMPVEAFHHAIDPHGLRLLRPSAA